MFRVNEAAKGETSPRQGKAIRRHQRRNVEISTFNKFTFFRGGQPSAKIGMRSPKNQAKDTKQGVYLGTWWEMPNFYKNVNAMQDTWSKTKGTIMRTKYITMGILAHVDAGKTTLSEAVLYLAGAIRKIGRVDHKNAFLDTDEIERERGITVFSKEARFETGGKEFTLLDTPGHTDFSSETERTLQVLDYAVLVVSGADGVQAHTVTLWKLFRHYGIPVFVFVNKMDRPCAERQDIIRELSEQLGGGVFADFGGMREADGAGSAGSAGGGGRGKERCDFDGRNAEEIAGASEVLMEEYLETGSFCEESIRLAIEKRELFPVFFGSALKLEGVEEFIEALGRFTVGKECGEEFGARVYKIGRDKQGNRLTYLKVTSGTLRNKMLVDGGEKIEQIRVYNGDSFQSVQSAGAGMVCAVMGPAGSYAGMGLGCEGSRAEPVLQPALSYEVILPAGQDPVTALAKLKMLEEEEPSLKVVWNEELKRINIQVMGELELEILEQVIERRFGMVVSFGSGGIIYKETIAAPVIGVGHYEPLRHYAEVQLLLEPLPRGSGLVFGSLVSEDKFALNWQRLVLTHLAERVHRGVLTGSEITDMRISIAAGRAHPKHTEGGDFRQATYRALRQGLRKAESILLEPMYAFRLQLPQEAVGRALTDLQRLGAQANLDEADLITGSGPVDTLREYSKEVASYTKGRGIFSVMPAGYMSCGRQDEIVQTIGYRPEADLENPTGSVFCEHGGAVYVNWDEVDAMAHLQPEPAAIKIVKGADEETEAGDPAETTDTQGSPRRGSQPAAGNDELEAIFLRTYGKSKRDEAIRRANLSHGMRDRAAKPAAEAAARSSHTSAETRGAAEQKPLYVIDGYNVIFAWEQLAALAKVNMDSAREALIDTLGNYMGYRNIDIVLVFDGYKLPGNPGTKTSYRKINEDSGELQVVYTHEAQTADRFIEKTVYEFGRKRRITVVTSDRPVQMAALGDGAARMSAREFYADVESVDADIREHLRRQAVQRNLPFEGLSTEND